MDAVYHIQMLFFFFLTEEFGSSLPEQHITDRRQIPRKFIPEHELLEEMEFIENEYLRPMFPDNSTYLAFMLFLSTTVWSHFVKHFVILKGRGDNGKVS